MEPTTTIKASVPSTQIDPLNPSWQEGLCLVGTSQFPSFASKGSFPCVVLRFRIKKLFHQYLHEGRF